MADFPDDAIAAAKAQLRAWEVPERGVPEILGALTDRLGALNKEGMRYGVGDAILSGKRMRWLHEAGGRFSQAQFNCAETGANTFLLLAAAGLEDRLSIARVNNRNGNSDHLLVLCDDGHDQPYFLDPICSKFGRARIMREAFIYTFTDEYPDNAERSASWNAYKGVPLLLAKEDLIRHVNYSNSPLGFFDYFRDGQKIIETPSKLPMIETHILTGDDDSLTVRVVGNDDLIDSYAFERTYRGGDHSDAHKIFLRMNWTTLQDVTYEESEGASILREPEDRFTHAGIFFTEIVNLYAQSLRFDDSDEWLSRLEKLSLEYHSNLNGFAEQLEQELAEAGEHQEEQQIARKKRNLTYYRDALLPYLEGLSPRSRLEYLHHRQWGDIFNHRRSRLPFNARSYLDKESASRRLEQYCNARKETFAPHVDSFLSSDIHRCLQSQYGEAVRIKGETLACWNEGE